MTRFIMTAFGVFASFMFLAVIAMWHITLGKEANLAAAYTKGAVEAPPVEYVPNVFEPKVIGSYAAEFYERGGLLFWKVYTIYTYPNKPGRTIVVSEYNASTNGTKEAKHVINASGRDANHRVKVYLGLIKEGTIVGSDLKYTGQGQELDIWDHYFDLSGVRLGDPVFFHQYKAQ